MTTMGMRTVKRGEGVETAMSPKSATKSTPSSRSSVLERAREYNRRIEEKDRQRSKSLEPDSSDSGSPRRSQSVGRNRASTHERAMASVLHESSASSPKEEMRSPREEGHTHEGHTQEGHIQEGRAVVTPELLVDALSGHEDGLLAIAERLMEHYDSGYDVMGEAIIDAFADVQKLFQHVVEAAHMEGAAFEASRREQEMAELREQAKGSMPEDVPLTVPANGPTRHDEFIDQDVKDVLTEAIRKGAPLRDKGKHTECFEMYSAACQSASELLPVDSDHRGRLQLSIARAESMSADRACAILRYAMDDVLRSGLRAGRIQLPDPSKRGDSVLPKPKDHPSLNGSAMPAGVVQSSEEALASLVEEMKEVLGAPVYDNTPLQDVAQRFWVALSEAQRSQLKNEEKLEQNLAKLKGEYLLARAVSVPLEIYFRFLHVSTVLLMRDFVLTKQEWEEKLTTAHETAETYKRKYLSFREAKSEKYMEQARLAASRLKFNQSDDDDDANTAFDSLKSRGTASMASSVSGLAQSARSVAGSVAGSFNCAGVNERSSVIIEAKMAKSASGRRSRSAGCSTPTHEGDRTVSSSESSRPSSASRSSVRQSRSKNTFREV